MQARNILSELIEGKNMTEEQTKFVMRGIMQGEFEATMVAALLVALRCKTETTTEIKASVEVMQELVVKVKLPSELEVVDLVGTGGDSQSTFNISTASMFVASAAGVTVAKHGNRAVSSKSGSADLLELAGANLSLNAEQITNIIKQYGIGFMFAPIHHQLMKNVVPIRKSIGIRTIFNVLGPLANPASAKICLIGVFEKELLHTYAKIMDELGVKKAWVVHGNGLDEIAGHATTEVVEINKGKINSFIIDPKDYGFNYSNLEDIKVADTKQSLAMINQVLDNEVGPAKDIVCLNAGAAIYLAGKADNFEAGIGKAQKVIAEGKAKEKFANFITATNNLQS